MSSSLDPTRRKKIEEIFEAVLEASASEVEGLLEEACGGDRELEREVRRLLEAHARGRGVLEGSPLEVRSVGDEDRWDSVPDRVGRYRILKEIGKGGMGAVFLAERADGHFQQRVAVKLIPHSDEELRARIVAERQILASLQHPNIARLLDGGVTDDGRPFLVMEYVSGLPIDVYSDRMRLSLRERLRLFLTVLEGVEHAHHNLVVHRDLKPSNILVSPSGKVKLLDFGIAKLLNPNLGGIDAPVTRMKDRALTPDYASPEQIRGEAITTVADLYSLGIILYELLTGYRPYSVGDVALPTLVTTVCEDDPPWPSARVMGRMTKLPGEEVPDQERRRAVANARHTTTARHVRSLKGDLDAIVMKALRKEPTRRYSSVELLAQDIRHYLGDLPVSARKGSRWYRLQKMVARNRPGAVAAFVVAVSILGGVGAALWQAGVASRERDRTEAALQESQEVTEFLLGLFEASDPQETPGDTVTVLDLLQRGERRASALEDTPRVQARLLQVMARAQHNLGHYGEAQTLAARAVKVIQEELGPDHDDLPGALLHWGRALKNEGRYERARRTLERALRTAHEGRDGGMEGLQTAEILEELARVTIYLGDLAGAESGARRALAIKSEILGPGDSSTLDALGILASIFRYQGRYERAETAFREVLDGRRRLESPDLTRLTGDILQVGDVLRLTGRDLDEAEALYRDAIALLHDGSARANQNFVWGLSSLGRLMELRGDLEEAEELLARTVEIRRRTFGDLHPLVSGAMGEYALFLNRIGRVEEAEALFRRAVEIDLETVGPNHTRHAGTLGGLATVLMTGGQLAKADSLIQRSLRIRMNAQGRRIPVVAQGLAAQADIKTRMGRFQESEALLEEALSIVSEQPPSAVVPRRIHAAFVRLYEGWNRPDMAERHRPLALPGR